jgi:uncharacterized protein YijF (DUF1287 family)
MHRRTFIVGPITAWLLARPAFAASTVGQKLANAARASRRDHRLRSNLDAHRLPRRRCSRSTGVCADVVIRAARDALGIDLQKLVHEDMAAHFDEYPARKAWGSKKPDTNIDHRRVLNLEAYLTRAGARLWLATTTTPGDQFPPPLEPGDVITWLLGARLPHIGIVVSVPASGATVVHNIGRGAEESPLAEFSPERGVAHYRWPVGTTP